MEPTFTNIVTNSIGAVAVTVIFLWYIDRQDSRTQKLIENELKNSRKTIAQNSKVISKFSTRIDHLMELVKETSLRKKR